jgi:hypothetical protein
VSQSRTPLSEHFQFLDNRRKDTGKEANIRRVSVSPSHFYPSPFLSVKLHAMFLRVGTRVPAVADPRHSEWLSGVTGGSVRTDSKNERPPPPSTTLRICGAFSPLSPLRILGVAHSRNSFVPTGAIRLTADACAPGGGSRSYSCGLCFRSSTRNLKRNINRTGRSTGARFESRPERHILTEIPCGFTQFLQRNAGIVPKLDHNLFLLNPS